MMRDKGVTLIVLLILAAFMVSLLQINSVQAENRIHIREDGSVEGTDQIHQDGDVYTIMGDITDRAIVVQRNNTVIDGNGYTISTPPSVVGYNIMVAYLDNVTIKNVTLKDSYMGILIEASTNVTILGNTVSIGDPGFFYTAAAIRIEGGGAHTIAGNTIKNSQVGIWLTESTHDNIIYNNNFINNEHRVYGSEEAASTTQWDNGYPSGGNYWSDYNGTDSDGDGIGDTPYVCIIENKTMFTDKYPLMKQAPLIPEFPSWIITPLLITLTFAAIFYKKRLTKSQATNRNHAH
jgi:parallel beta-helix repeat protein